MRIQANINNHSNTQFKGIYSIKGKEKDLSKFVDKWNTNRAEGTQLQRYGRRVPGNIVTMGEITYLGNWTGKKNNVATLVVATNDDVYDLMNVLANKPNLKHGMSTFGIYNEHSDSGANFTLGAIMALCPNFNYMYEYSQIEKALNNGRFNMVTGTIE